LYLVAVIVGIHVYGQKELPVFTQFGECFLNAGKCDDIVIKDNIAYIGSEAGLLILEINAADEPEFLSCYYTDKFVFKIFLTDTLAFITSYNGYGSPLASIINISNPHDPVLIHSFEAEGSENTSIFVQDDLLFLGMGSSGLFIYDISDLFNPVIVTHLSDIKCRDMVVKDKHIYMVANSYYFGIVDISIIGQPEILCWIGGYGASRLAIDLQGNFAYVAGKTLDIFDVSDPANPNQVCELEVDSDWLLDLSVSENFCYSMSNDSLFVINVENPVSPAVLAYFDYTGNFLSFDDNLLAVSKAYAYEDSYGIGFFDVDDVQQINLEAAFISDKAREVFAGGNYAYVSNGYNGLQIICTETPANPVTVSNCLNKFYVVETIVEDGIAYVRTLDGLKIVDVSNPEIPITLSEYDLQSGPANARFAIEKYHNYIYLGGDWLGEIYVVDVSHPTNPLNVGQINVIDWSSDIEVFHDHLYVAGYWGGLQIFDLTDPVNPQTIGYHPLGLALKIAVGNNMAFVGGAVDPNTGGIEIFDLSNLNNPFHTGTYEIGTTDMQCVGNSLIFGHRAYQDINSSIQVVDMADLNNPVLKQEIIDLAPNGIFYSDNLIYAAEDFKFKIFGDSLTVSTNDIIAENSDSTILIFPNPAIGTATIEFHVNKSSGFVKLNVYNSKGGLVTKLIQDNLAKGLYSVDWDCNNNSGSKVSPGVYFVTLQLGNSQASKKLILTGN